MPVHFASRGYSERSPKLQLALPCKLLRDSSGCLWCSSVLRSPLQLTLWTTILSQNFLSSTHSSTHSLAHSRFQSAFESSSISPNQASCDQIALSLDESRWVSMSLDEARWLTSDSRANSPPPVEHRGLRAASLSNSFSNTTCIHFRSGTIREPFGNRPHRPVRTPILFWPEDAPDDLALSYFPYLCNLNARL